MRLIFEKDTNIADVDLVIYFTDGRLTAQFRTLSEDCESCHFETVWRGEPGAVDGIMAGLIAVEYCGHPLICFGDIAEIHESLVKAISDSRRLEQQTMNLGVAAGTV